MKPEDLPFKTPHELSDRVVVVRGLKVILDSDLAELYGVPTKRLNEKVRRHPGLAMREVNPPVDRGVCITIARYL